MGTTGEQHAVRAALAVAAELGLEASEGVVLQASNRVTVRVLPCDTVCRVAPIAYRASAEFEVALARRLVDAGAPVAALEPRVKPQVVVRDGFAINLWSYYDHQGQVEPREYARALSGLHAGMRAVALATPYFTDRVADAQRLVDTPSETPELVDGDRAFLSTALRRLERAILARGAPEQLLHGEPHTGNLLNTTVGPRFIDLETCCRGPVEFDIAYAPDDVAAHYAGLDGELLRDGGLLKLAMVAAWRWDRSDEFPGGRQMGIDLVAQLRAAFEGGETATLP